MESILHDIRYSIRMLRKSPGFTAVAALSLIVGIGICCAVLSEIQSIVGPPPGIRNPSALVTFQWSLVSYPYFEQYRDQHQTIATATALLGPVPFAVAFNSDKATKAERFYGQLVSPEYFSTLGVMPALGRFFSPKTEKPGTPPVVVLSYRFWHAQFAADPHVIGRSLRLNGRLATIVGVGPKNFLGIWPGNPCDLFVPVTSGVFLAPELRGDPLHNPNRESFRVVFRLSPGITLRTAEPTLIGIMRNLDRENGIERDPHDSFYLMAAGTILYITPEQRRFTNAFMVVLCALVLALVCANLASLWLARTADRRHEIAIRRSLGGSRLRLVRQLLTESVLLSLAGAAGGIVLAYWLTRVLCSLTVPSPIPIELHCELAAPLVAVTVGIALAAGVVFGLAPALSSVSTDLASDLKRGAYTSVGKYGRFRLRNLFVTCQMAVSLMLLLVTGLVAMGFLLATRLDPGFKVADLNLVSLDPVRDGYTPAQTAALIRGLRSELSKIHGIRSVSLSGAVPFSWLSAEMPNTRVSSKGRDGERMCTVFEDRVGTHYFATLQAPLLMGREFERDDEADTSGTAIPAMLNQTAARCLFGPDDPIGRPVREGKVNYTVVGIARDIQSGFLNSKPVATMFLPFTASTFRENPTQPITLLVRGRAGEDTLTAVRSELDSAHPDLTVFNARTLQEDLGRLKAFVEWESTIYLIFGAFALLLACIGVAAVSAYAVVQRRKEIGIRLALGARGLQVQRLVMREGMTLIAAGLVLGFGGALFLSRTLAGFSSMLARSFSQPVSSPLLMVGAPLLLGSLGMLSCYLPARQASTTDPMITLRDE